MSINQNDKLINLNLLSNLNYSNDALSHVQKIEMVTCRCGKMCEITRESMRNEVAFKLIAHFWIKITWQDVDPYALNLSFKGFIVEKFN